jgi:TRAP-type uncharacterized transport system substrate-binding protein
MEIMSADATPPQASPKPLVRPHAVHANRRQLLLYAAATVILTIATVWGTRVWLKNSETLAFAVGDINGVEYRFAQKLAAVLKNTNSRLRLKTVSAADGARALAEFDRHQADLAVLRTDAKIPPRARAFAILEHDELLLLGPGARKIGSLAELKKKKIAVVGDGDANLAFVRGLLEIPDGSDAAKNVQLAPPNTTPEKLFAAGGYSAVVVIAHASKIVKDKSYEQFARHGGFTLNAIDAAKSLVRKNPAISEETIETGMLSASPAIPDDDLATIGLQWLLVGQSTISPTTAEDLARTIYENKAELALEDGFASQIEPADTDKDAFIVAHRGAAEYINDNTKSFMERYSDVMYLGTAALGVIGSIFAGLYTKVTRTLPQQAGELATEILGIGERVQHAATNEALDGLRDELETILRGVVIGLHDGTVSDEGLESFKLGYQFTRDQIAIRREALRRGGDDNVVIVKTAQSA